MKRYPTNFYIIDSTKTLCQNWCVDKMQIKNQKSKSKNIGSDGYVMLITTIIFMIVSLIIVFGLSTSIIKQILLSRDIWSAKQSYYLSESGVEDVLYRLKDSNMSSNLAITETLTLDGYNAVTQITSNPDGKTITALSDQKGYKKSIETKVTMGSGTSFNYRILSGNGGFVLTGGSSVTGNVYSNGDILGGSGVQITGSAIAASGGSIFEDQNNKTPIPSPSSITFNNTYTFRDFAESFQSSTTSVIQKVSIYIKTTNSPSDFVVNLMSDSSGIPGSILATSLLDSSKVSSNFGWIDLVFSQNVTLTKDTTYWVVIVGDTTRNKTGSGTYTIGANNLYARGIAKIGRVGDVWSTTNLDGYFSLSLSSVHGKIFGNEGNYLYIGSTSTDMAWAGDVSHVSMTGHIYCQKGINNDAGKNCDMSKDLPGTMPMPISESNIDQWKVEALTGGIYNGNYFIDSDGGILGPRKIVGNLTVNGGGTLMITGTIWVTGNIIATGGGKIKISPALGSKSVIILANGYVSVDGNGKFEGSGTAGSYPVVVSTSVCPNTTPCATNNAAIYLSGGAGAVVLNAPYGKVNINGNSGARSVSGNSIYISGGGHVTYDTGLANLSFSSGPSGGWHISSWKELED